MIMISIVATSIAQGLTVPAAQLGLWWLYAARVITGFITGFLYAPIFSLLGFWAPRYEISLLLGCAGMGLELGNTVSFCVSMGACEVDFQGGWPLVFYILAAFGMVVAVLVGVFVSDSPLDNRFISQTEVDVIASAIPANFEKNNKAVAMIPVKKILTSMPVWAIVVSQLGSSMAYYMVINSLPMFFKDVIKVPALEVNLLSGLPFVAIIPTIYVIGMVSDRLVSGGYMSRTKCRKMNDFVNKIVVGCILVGMGFVPEGSTALAFVLNTAAAIALGFAYVSWLTNPTDLAPTFTGFIVGIGEMGSVWISIAIPLVVNHFTADKQRSSWQIVFIATACLQVCCFVFYLIFASGELQPWAVTTYKKDYGSVSLDKKNETVEVL